MRLDHLSYAAGPEGLGACAQRLGARLGAPFTDGGLHPAFGTRNFVLPLAGSVYLEVVAALDHPAAESAPFGRAVAARSRAGGGWLAWAVQVEDITIVEQRLARPAAAGHRRRPDGHDLQWRQIGLADVARDPQLPFFVQWLGQGDDHPSSAGSAITLTAVDINGEQETVDDYLGVPHGQPLAGIEVNWVPDDTSDAGLIAAHFETPGGLVRLD